MANTVIVDIQQHQMNIPVILSLGKCVSSSDESHVKSLTSAGNAAVKSVCDVMWVCSVVYVVSLRSCSTS